jgi:hypothetical protein
MKFLGKLDLSDFMFLYWKGAIKKQPHCGTTAELGVVPRKSDSTGPMEVTEKFS